MTDVVLKPWGTLPRVSMVVNRWARESLSSSFSLLRTREGTLNSLVPEHLTELIAFMTSLEEIGLISPGLSFAQCESMISFSSLFLIFEVIGDSTQNSSRKMEQVSFSSCDGEFELGFVINEMEEGRLESRPVALSMVLQRCLESPGASLILEQVKCLFCDRIFVLT